LLSLKARYGLLYAPTKPSGRAVTPMLKPRKHGQSFCGLSGEVVYNATRSLAAGLEI